MSQVYNVWRCDVCASYHPLYKDCRGKELHNSARRAACDARKAIACGKCHKAFSTDQEAMATKCCYTMLPDMDSHTNSYTPSALRAESIPFLVEAFGTLHTIDKDGNMTPLSEIRNIKSITEASQYNESEAITTQAVNSINAFIEALNNLDNAIKIDALRESLDNLGLYQAEAIIRSAMSEQISNGSGINKSITIEHSLCTDELAEQRAEEIMDNLLALSKNRDNSHAIEESIRKEQWAKRKEQCATTKEELFNRRQKLIDALAEQEREVKKYDQY